MAKEQMTYRVGQEVFVTGGKGRVTEVRDDGSYVVEMAWGETVVAWPNDMAPRI